MALLSVIRRWHLREGRSVREIARRTGLPRNTVRKYLNSGAVEPKYPLRKTPSKLDEFAGVLEQWLECEPLKSRKQRRNLRRIYSDLVELGYRGSYDRVAAYARRFRQQQHEREQTAGRGTFVPLTFAPSEAFQFDWSEDSAVIAGERRKVMVAQFKLCHSRAFVLRAYWLQTHEMLFDAHNHAFRVLGGVPRRGIYDNMKTAVDKVRRGKVRDVNVRFRAMVSHFLFEAEFCNPAAGSEKGQIEKNVQDARHRLWQHASTFESLAALNEWLEQRCQTLWQELPHPEHRERHLAEVWADEVPHLMALPAPFDGFVEHTKRVSPTCLINYERNRYSVPAAFANRPVSVHAYADRIVVVAEGQQITEHRRVFNRSHDTPGRTLYDWRHYLAVIQRKPGALRNGAPFTELPSAFRQLQAILHHHRRVRCFSTIELVNALELEKAAGKQGQMADRLAHADLVILDELGYLPFSQSGGALLFHLISKLYERTSLIIITNLSFTNWPTIFGDPKMTTAASKRSIWHTVAFIPV